MPGAMFVWLYQVVQFNIINSTNIYKKKKIYKKINLKTSITQRPSSVLFKINCRIYYHKLWTLQNYQVLIGLKAVCEFSTCICIHALLNSILFKFIFSFVHKSKWRLFGIYYIIHNGQKERNKGFLSEPWHKQYREKKSQLF